VLLQGCDVVAEIAKPEFKARMTVKLAVAGAFHTDYMAPAVEKLRDALAQTPLSAPRIPVISNVDGLPHSDPDTIKDILARQVRTSTPLCPLLQKWIWNVSSAVNAICSAQLLSAESRL
jgi:acyl transferase domain-containing protein